MRLGEPDLSWVGPDGFPLSIPVRAERTVPGFRLRFGHCLPGAPQGRACLTFHSHPEKFTGQENHSFVGNISAAGPEGAFCVDRLLPDVSFTGSRLTAALGFLGKRRRMAPRLQAEAARRGQVFIVIHYLALGVLLNAYDVPAGRALAQLPQGGHHA